MRSYFDEHPDLDVSVYVVWLPMFPTPMEWWALPRMAEEFSGWGIPQYWDDERHVSKAVKERLVPEIEQEVPWDLFILFGPEASWADAEQHVLGWGEPVIDEAKKLEALLSAVPEGGTADLGQ